MKLHQLLIFNAVAEEKSLRAAARKLNLTQPAVTRVAQELESELGVALMTRSTQGIELTQYGLALKARGRRVLEEVRRAREEIDQIKGNLSGKVRVGVTPTIALAILPRAMRRFREQAPEAEISFVEVRYPVSEGLLQDPLTDFVVCHVTENMLDENVRSIPLFSTDFFVLARKGHRLANAHHVAELMDEEWVATNLTGTFRQMFEQQGLPLPRRIIRSASFAVTVALVSSTDSLGFFSELLVQSIAGLGLHEVPLENRKPRLQMTIVTRKDALLTPVAQLFMTCLQEVSKQLSTEP